MKPSTVTLSVEQACAVYALQRLSKMATDDAMQMKQFGQRDAAAVLEATVRKLDTETEKLLESFQSALVRPPGLVRPA